MQEAESKDRWSQSKCFQKIQDQLWTRKAAGGTPSSPQLRVLPSQQQLRLRLMFTQLQNSRAGCPFASQKLSFLCYFCVFPAQRKHERARSYCLKCHFSWFANSCLSWNSRTALAIGEACRHFHKTLLLRTLAQVSFLIPGKCCCSVAVSSGRTLLAPQLTLLERQEKTILLSLLFLLLYPSQLTAHHTSQAECGVAGFCNAMSCTMMHFSRGLFLAQTQMRVSSAKVLAAA